MDTLQEIPSRLFDRRALTRLILPLMIEQTLAMSVGMIDTVMISGIGEASVSGVSLVDMINALVINLFAALATGGAVVVSGAIGAKRQKDACTAATQLLFIVAVIAVGVTGICLILNRSLISLFFGAIERDVMDAASTYFYITALSFPFLAVYNSAAALFRSMGNSAVSMIVSAIGNGMNIVGNTILIYVIPMGVAGAAISTLISRFAMMLMLLIILRNPKHSVRPEYKGFRPNRKVIGNILGIGIPSGIENGVFSLGRILVVSIIAGFGTTQIAANAVANTLNGVGCIPGQAIGLAMITVVGQCVGLGDEAQARYYIRKLMKITYSIHSGLNVLLAASVPLIIRLYHLSASTEKLAIFLVVFHCLWAAAIWPMSFTFPNALRAMRDVRFTMIVSVSSMIAFRLTLSLILGKQMGYGAIGVWIAMVTDWVCRTVCFTLRYRSGKWRAKAHFADAEQTIVIVKK